MIKTVLHSRWIDNATAGLHTSLRGDLQVLKVQVKQGLAQLWEIETQCGQSWMISRSELLPDGQKELVICCYAGCDIKAVTAFIVDSATAQGFASIRYHTQRQGLNRLLSPYGFTPYETIYHKQLIQGNHHGRA